MKKTTKRWIACALFICMILGAPFHHGVLGNVEAANKETASDSAMPMPEIPNWTQEKEEDSSSPTQYGEEEPVESGQELESNTKESESINSENGSQSDESESESQRKESSESESESQSSESSKADNGSHSSENSEPESGSQSSESSKSDNGSYSSENSEPESGNQSSENGESESGSQSKESSESESGSETIDGEYSELTTEVESEKTEETESETEEITETISQEDTLPTEEQETNTSEGSELPTDAIEEATLAYMLVDITEDGVYGYREWRDGRVKPEIQMSVVINETETSSTSNSEEDTECEEATETPSETELSSELISEEESETQSQSQSESDESLETELSSQSEREEISETGFSSELISEEESETQSQSERKEISEPETQSESEEVSELEASSEREETSKPETLSSSDNEEASKPEASSGNKEEEVKIEETTKAEIALPSKSEEASKSETQSESEEASKPETQSESEEATKPETQSESEEAPEIEPSSTAISEEEFIYQICVDNTEVIDFDVDNVIKTSFHGSAAVYETKQKTVPFNINTVGTATLKITAIGNSKYNVGTVEKVITINNGTLYNEDFYIEVKQESDSKAKLRRYSYEEWCQYLDSHHHWVDGAVYGVVSDSGRRYYDTINLELSAPSDEDKIQKQTYILWAENLQTKANTKEASNGTRTFEAEVDTKIPVLKSFVEDNKCYEPTKTDTEQYFAEDFVLRGTYQDEGSGIRKIEYTTNFMDEKNAKWTTVNTVQEAGTMKVDFEIVLSDGCYGAVALRAFDYAGNVSAVKGIVNGNGNYVKLIVDKSEPVLNVNAVSGGAEYSGAGDNWTNKDVVYTLTFDEDSCPYAGVYQYAYLYEKIGDAVNRENMALPSITNLSGKWIQMKPNGLENKLEIKEDKNGYYYFQAVSKSGVKTKKIVSQRLLVQHQLAEVQPIEVKGVDDTKRKNNWYNKNSGTPVISFVYPEYDSGVTSKEYDAPITIHYHITKEKGSSDRMKTDREDAVNFSETDTDKVNEGETAVKIDADKTAAAKTSVTDTVTASIGVMGSDALRTNSRGKKEFVLTKDNLDGHVIDFGYDTKTGYAKDGIYTLEYWVTDKAGNSSKKQMVTYKIDCHEPTNLTVEVAQMLLPINSEKSVVYERFYQEAVKGNVNAEYGISGKGTLQVLKVRNASTDNAVGKAASDEQFTIESGMRCFLYVRAEDFAGNVTEGWTRGIVVDDTAPSAANGRELFIEPEGANEHGFYNKDVRVKISIKDAPEPENCAALMAVTSSIGRDGIDTVANESLFSFTKELPTDEELEQAAAFEKVQVVKAADNNSNEAYIKVTAIDRAGNERTATQRLKIDITKPELAVSFDTENAVNGSFYKQGRTATIHVQELNFDPEGLELIITKDGQPVELPLSEWTAEGVDHYATVFFGEDGDYTMEACFTDLADNVSDTVQAAPFTIDCTAPQMEVAFAADGQNQPVTIENHDYFHTGVTVDITVTEHNFDMDGFMLEISPVARGAVWSHKGDEHTAHITLDAENAYQLRCAYTDLAGNDAVNEAQSKEFIKEFTIDTTAPELAISGVVDGSANSGEVIPVITALDSNMDAEAVAISVVTGKGVSVENTIVTTAAEDGSGYQYVLSDLTEKADDIYYLSITAQDRAGNESLLKYRFSLNRNGSAYDLTQLAKLMDRQYTNYESFEDIVLTEMNVDKVDQFEVYISRNGALGYKADYERKVSGSADTGYIYTYRIKRKNFAEEGSYRLSLYSKDKAGNEVNNALKLNGNEIAFVVDNSVPKVMIDGVEAGNVQDVKTQEISITVADNFRLSEAKFMLVNSNNEVLESWDYMELSQGKGGTVHITIPTYDEEVSLIYKVTDTAGNEMQTQCSKETAAATPPAAKDKVVEYVNKPAKTVFGYSLLPFFAGVIGLCLICTILFVRRKKGCDRTVF